MTGRELSPQRRAQSGGGGVYWGKWPRLVFPWQLARQGQA
jgi:hypothetical protein